MNEGKALRGSAILLFTDDMQIQIRADFQYLDGRVVSNVQALLGHPGARPRIHCHTLWLRDRKDAIVFQFWQNEPKVMTDTGLPSARAESGREH